MSSPHPTRRFVLLMVAAAVAAPGAATAAGGEELLGEARRLYGVGAAHFEAGRHGAAVRSFRAALAMADRPSLHFNLACALEADGRPADALDEYRLYLADRPEAPDRADLEGLIAWLEAGLSPERSGARAARPGRPTPAAAVLPEPLPLPPAEGTDLLAGQAPSAAPVAAWATLGGAGLAALAAGWFGVQAARADAVYGAARLRTDSPAERSRVAGLAEEARHHSLYADVAAAGAVAAAAVGTWLLLREPKAAGSAGGASGRSAPPAPAPGL